MDLISSAANHFHLHHAGVDAEVSESVSQDVEKTKLSAGLDA